MSPGLTVVWFGAGRHRFAVEALQVAGMRAAPVIAGPGERVVVIEDLIGLGETPESGPGRRWLLLRSDGPACWVEVSAPVHLGRLDAAIVHPLPPLVGARMALAGVAALAQEGEEAALIVDLRTAVRTRGGEIGTPSA